MELKYVQSELGLFNDLLLILVDFDLFLISKVPCYPLVAGMACFEGSPASCLPFEQKYASLMIASHNIRTQL